jgi:penicillin amidase
MLRRLGEGESITAICAATGWPRDRFDAWWQEECRKRVPPAKGTQALRGLKSAVRITRDRWGIPHVHADNDRDLFFGFGYATAQDRLFQLEYLRRKARGTLAEVIGPEAVDSDVLYRTIGLARIAEAELRQLPAETADLLAAYTAGINALMEASRDNLPIEFDLLGYRPEPWRPADSLAIEGEFRWYLTGRFPVIAIPELARRTLGAGPLYQAFLQGEEDDESILRPGEYPAGKPRPGKAGGGGDGPGSNNWVLAGSRTTTGLPIVANDPHIPLYAVSIWHEVVLRGGSFHVSGVALAGMPAIMIGRNRRVAWGITNNICSLRDLYQEKTDPVHPGCFLFDGKWEPARQWEECIAVKGAAPVKKILRASRNGPIVDEILPAQARHTGPVSLRWVGFEYCGWLTALLGTNKSRNCAEFRQATRPWAVPTFNLVFADADGHTGFQCVGKIPVRDNWERGYRPGWDPKHQWQSYIPFEALPHLIDPPRGFVVTANNRTAPGDYPYPLSGTWSGGHRARRIREMIEAKPKHSREACQAMQLDVTSNRARMVVRPLVAILQKDGDERVRKATDVLASWDCVIGKDSAGAALFNVFMVHWLRAVTSERFPPESAAFVTTTAGGLAIGLLDKDSVGWFERTKREDAVRRALVAALDDITAKLGPDMSQWRWGRLHALQQKHFLSSRGDLGTLLDRSGLPVGGDGHTVNSATPDANYAAWLGAGYRMVADMADPRAGLWAVEVGSASGHPGSPHYDDQIAPWSAGQFHYLPLDDAPVDGPTLTLTPV